jgi:hypothetical protein
VAGGLVSPRPSIRPSPGERERTGALATIRRERTGELRTAHFTAPSESERTRAIAAWCDAAGSDWRVVAISTPQSVFADLVNDGRRRAPGGEATALGMIGRGDLVPYQRSDVGTRTVGLAARKRRG